MKLLLWSLIFVLSFIAGSVDVISFLGLNGLFVSHITGNLVILAVRIVNAGEAPLALILSVPIFVIVLILTKFLVICLKKYGWDSLLPLVILQWLFLIGFFVLGITGGPHPDPNAGLMILAGMLGVSAMAVQNALVHLSLKNFPATAVMTTNLTRFFLNLGVNSSDQNNKKLVPAIVGFTLGCAIGALLQAKYEFWALLLPIFLALVTMGLVLRIKHS